MKKVIAWLENNKLSLFLLLVVAYLVLRPRWLSSMTPAVGGRDFTMTGNQAIIPAPEAAPLPEAEERMVSEQSDVSLLVDDVRQSVNQVIAYAESKGGYLVSSGISQPEEAPFATVVLRVPQPELRPALEYLRGLAVRVTSENLQGKDVTDQYFDLEARLETLNKTKAKFEEILNRAVNVNDILQVQRELVSLQSQIDNLKGRQEYLKKTAENAKLTVYLSSDEWSLPYMPEKPFRAKVIFKQAVRSLVTALRALVKALIWVAVYALVWLPILIIIKVIKKSRRVRPPRREGKK
jgi:hypothetical protein